MTSSMRLPVSTSAVAMIVSEPPSSMLRAAPKNRSRFDANEAGWQVRKPRCDASTRDFFSQYDGTVRIEADHVKCGLPHVYSDGGHCANRGLARHDDAPAPDTPAHSESRQGRERGRSIPFASVL